MMNAIEFKDHLIKDVLKPGFKKAGFKVSGTHFTKEEEGFVKVFNVQSSQFSLNWQTGFYLNIGLFFPLAYAFRYNEYTENEMKFPEKPKESDCQFRFRSGLITKGLKSYNIDKNTNQAAFKEIVIKDIEESILPFYNSIKSLDDCLYKEIDFPLASGTTTAFVALTFATLGKQDKAKQVLITYLANENIPDKWRSKIVNEARKRNVEL